MEGGRNHLSVGGGKLKALFQTAHAIGRSFCALSLLAALIAVVAGQPFYPASA